ncbi:MAG TPA: hypothetical protein VIY27_04940 [Myxococcota bacterium]
MALREAVSQLPLAASPALTRSALFAALLLGFFALEVASFPRFEPVHSGDETVWRTTGSQPALSLAFYTGGRPFSVPLLHKLAGWNEPAVILFQSLLSVACWFGLALALALELPGVRAQLACAALVCLFSLTTPINQWDPVIRSESVFFSSLALVLALTLVGVRRATAGRLGAPFVLAWALACLLFAGSRESATYFLDLLWLALAAALAAARPIGPRARPHAAALLALALLASVLAFSHWTTARSLRWHTPLVNVLLQRILPDDEARELWVARYALPQPSSLAPYVGRSAWDPTENGQEIRQRLLRDPAFAADQSWLMERGMRSYQRYLAWDALLPSLAAAFDALGAHANDANMGFAQGAGRTLWARAATLVLYPMLPAGGLLCLGVIAFSGAVALYRPRARRLALCTAFLALSAVAQSFVNYHGDADDVRRHMAVCGLLLRLALLFMLATALLALSGRAGAGGAPAMGSRGSRL